MEQLLKSVIYHLLFSNFFLIYFICSIHGYTMFL
jgi:hypothetical protein